MNSNNGNSNSNKNKNKNNNNKKPTNPKYIARSKYFKVSTRDTSRIKNIKEGMNHLFDQRNHELEEIFLQEATQYTERVLGETRRINWSEEESQGAMDIIFNNSLEEIISGAEAERELEESETDSEEVLALQERIQQEDQEEYDRIRAELEEEEKANKNN